MSDMNAAAGPMVIFGDLDGDIWGIVLGGERPRAAVAGLTEADVAFRAAELDVQDDDVWTLTAPGCALRIERADVPTATADGAHALLPCRVSGCATAAGSERELDVGGMRTDALALDGNDSLRLFSAWFPAGHELGLLAERPQNAKGQDRDRVAVVARGEEHPLVLDPRLSTTYDGDGQPRRAGLELWLADEEDGELWPRRMAGAATGSRVEDSGIAAYAFECISRGEGGAGIYVLARAA